MAKGVTFSKYREMLVEILTNNDEIISKQYIGLTESFYKKQMNEWISLFSDNHSFEKFKYGTIVFNGKINYRLGSTFDNDPRKDEVLDLPYIETPRNDKQFICLMIGKECIWYDEMVMLLVYKYK
jgi:hypothetical protein